MPKKAKPGKRGRKPGGGDDLTSRMTAEELEAFVASRRPSMRADRCGAVIPGVVEFEARKYGRLAIPVRVTSHRRVRPPSEW